MQLRLLIVILPQKPQIVLHRRIRVYDRLAEGEIIRLPDRLLLVVDQGFGLAEVVVQVVVDGVGGTLHLGQGVVAAVDVLGDEDAVCLAFGDQLVVEAIEKDGVYAVHGFHHPLTHGVVCIFPQQLAVVEHPRKAVVQVVDEGLAADAGRVAGNMGTEYGDGDDFMRF